MIEEKFPLNLRQKEIVNETILVRKNLNLPPLPIHSIFDMLELDLLDHPNHYVEEENNLPFDNLKCEYLISFSEDLTEFIVLKDYPDWQGVTLDMFESILFPHEFVSESKQLPSSWSYFKKATIKIIEEEK